MARIKIEDVIEHLSSDIRRALRDAVKDAVGEVPFDERQLFRSFVRQVGRKCSTWESVPDHLVDT